MNGPNQAGSGDRGAVADMHPEQGDTSSRRVTHSDTTVEWRRPMTGVVLDLLAFETITGLLIYLAPFSTFNQFGVVWHSVIGWAMLPPVAWYLGQHGWRRLRVKFNRY